MIKRVRGLRYFRGKAFGKADNKNPRAQVAQLEGVGARTYAAQENAWEAALMFTAAVLTSHLAGLSAEAATPWALALGLVALLLGATGFFTLSLRHGPPRAVLQASKVEVKSGPGAQYATLFEIHAGALVRVLDERGDWRRVQLVDGPGGWLAADTVAIFGRPETLPPLPAPFE